MRLTLHAKIEITIVAALILGSCQQKDDGPTVETAYDLADVANVNARRAIGAANELDQRIDEIENRLNM